MIELWWFQPKGHRPSIWSNLNASCVDITIIYNQGLPGEEHRNSCHFHGLTMGWGDWTSQEGKGPFSQGWEVWGKASWKKCGLEAL